MSDYTKLAVWKRAHQLTLRLYSATATFPKSELFGLTSQIRRSASSVGANLAEGCGRRSDRELRRFITTSIGSCNELDYHLLLAGDLGYVEGQLAAELRSEAGEIGRMLSALLSKVDERIAEQRRQRS